MATLSNDFENDDKFKVKFYYDGKGKSQSQELDISYTESNFLTESYPNIDITIHGESLEEVLKYKDQFIDDLIIKLQKLKGDIDEFGNSK